MFYYYLLWIIHRAAAYAITKWKPLYTPSGNAFGNDKYIWTVFAHDISLWNKAWKSTLQSILMIVHNTCPHMHDIFVFSAMKTCNHFNYDVKRSPLRTTYQDLSRPKFKVMELWGHFYFVLKSEAPAGARKLIEQEKRLTLRPRAELCLALSRRCCRLRPHCWAETRKEPEPALHIADC